ncbi:polysaccharide deacetylase family protein [Paenibacillus thermoaerophilus]|uniref:Polysaccharide deacetylase family protein n=1 Tax=Paenibacillus thermoaerophilus TaxID=1215385 RepID=A0ABW2V1Z3_9BACL|nr:polysaccharide deacetylase family protein [Paenibacillus thermoaerophilus]TMV13933.1 polysaccharide deacetylase [Paenibacillus thermoaerophilus]
MRKTLKTRRLAAWALALVTIAAGTEGVAAAAERETSPALTEADRAVYERLVRGERVYPDRAYAAPDEPTVYLSFDDGPSKWTPQVLDILREEGVKATFFMLGSQAEAYPDYVRMVAEEGHAIGNHTYNHRYGELYPEYESFRDQVERTSGILAGILGEAPRLVRAPGGSSGHFTPFHFYLLEQAGYAVFDWNVDSGDALRRNARAADIVRGATPAKLPAAPHVLLHDGGNREQTVAALPEIIRYYKDKGYRFGKLDASVEPVQFRYSPGTPPGRPMTEKRFGNLLAEARRIAAERGIGGDSPAVPGEGSREEGPLRLTAGPSGRSATLEAGEYELTGGRFWVSPARLAEVLGADARPAEAPGGAVTVRAGKRVIRIDPALRSVLLIDLSGYTKRLTLAEMKTVGGELRVPLRTAAEWFGSGVARYDLAPERHVELMPAGSFAPSLAGWRAPLWSGPERNRPSEGAPSSSGRPADGRLEKLLWGPAAIVLAASAAVGLSAHAAAAYRAR